MLLGPTGASAVVASPFVSRAWAAEFTFEYADDASASHPMDVRAQEAAKRILTETSGRFDSRVFPDNRSGRDSDVLGQLRSGAVECFSLSPLGDPNLLVSFVGLVGLMVPGVVPIAFAFGLATSGSIAPTTTPPADVAIDRLSEGMRHLIRAIQGFHAGRRTSGIGGADGGHGFYEFTETRVVYIQGR